METNKLTINDQFLTLDQAKELQKLGIDFSGAIYCFGKRIKDGRGNKMLRQKPFLCPSGNHGVRSVLLEQYEFIPTLSVAEMIEMLPKCIEVKDVLCELYLKKSSFYVGDMTYELGYRGYLNESLSIKEFTYPLLRDALFEMLKWLKQNKMI